MTEPANASPIASPCTGVCRLGGDGYCEGCLRTATEIAGWMGMADSERRWLMDCVLPLRGVQQSK